jgi:predicted nucleic acid-binding protein
MAANVLVDTSFLVALIDRRDPNHGWASMLPGSLPPPWQTCEAVLSETFHLLGAANVRLLIGLMRGNALVTSGLMEHGDQEVLDLMEKYADVPMSFADACLVRMTEILPNPTLLTTDSDFRIYRRLGRKTVPAVMPQDIA